ncbi:hypothetical protein SCUCBS95973_008608 [Sporothrix curviconia]|uniref:Zn(2)-C6 fungal-type domain-containing protein n=1 Tax=Sporothrix curviconia TaxID=1260050 RepID=A0ABP0CMX1_9PEZI
MASSGSAASPSAQRSGGGAGSSSAGGSSRVLLACDYCRHRKSRCDGLRPSCTHCVQSNRECVYRNTAGTILEPDATVLARLADMEARLQALEDNNRVLQAKLSSLTAAESVGGVRSPVAAVAAVLAGAPQPMELFHEQQQQHHNLQGQQSRQQQGRQSRQQQRHQHDFEDFEDLDDLQAQQQPIPQQANPAEAEAVCTPPDLHTAAAFKLLTCWPRLTINMTVPRLDTQTYLITCDRADRQLCDPSAWGNTAGQAVHKAHVGIAMDQLYKKDIYERLPVAVKAIFEAYPPFQQENMLHGITDAIRWKGNTALDDYAIDVSMEDARSARDVNEMDGMDEVADAAAMQLQQFHGGSSHNTYGDSLHGEERQRVYMRNWQRRERRDHRNYRDPFEQPPAHACGAHFGGLSFGQLLVVSLAFRVEVGNNRMSRVYMPLNPPGPSVLMPAAAYTCNLALKQLWMLQGGPAEDLVPQVLLMAYFLADFWVRPFHALGLLQSIDQAIKSMGKLQADDPRVQLYARLHFNLESDILTEVNGFSTLSSASLLALPPLKPASSGSGSSGRVAASPFTPSSSSASTVAEGLLPRQPRQPQQPRQHPDEFYIENHTRLRILHNRILHQLYAPTKAYAQPHELADIVRNLSAGLSEWYQALPPDQQFVRDATVYRTNQPGCTPVTANNNRSASMPLRLREMALRYFGCVFLLHRPVLYFFLHKDLEYTVRPPENLHTLHIDSEPWVLNSCSDCIESAAMLIYFACARPPQQSSIFWRPVEDSYGPWCSLQMLFAAYLILLQVRSVPSLEPIFSSVGDSDVLLDMVEHAFATHPMGGAALVLEMDTPAVLDQSLMILKNERRNFEAASPQAHMT